MLIVAAVVLYGVAPAHVRHAGDRHVGRTGKSDALAQAGHAHQEARRGADEREHDRVVPGVVGDDHDRGPNQGWDRVEPPA